MWIYGMVIVLYLLLVWFSRREQTDPGTVRGARVWYRCAVLLRRKFVILRRFDVNTLAIAAAVIAGGCLLGMAVSFWEYKDSLIEIESLEKGGYEDGAYQESLQASEEDGQLHTFDIEIPGRIYTAEQIEEMFQKAVDDMEGYILGENESVDYIASNMSLITQIPNTPINVEWSSDRPEVLDRDGELGSQIPVAGVKVKITAELTYMTSSKTFTRSVKVFPAVLTKEEQRRQQILEEIEKRNPDVQTDYFYLPDAVEGRRIYWFRPETVNGQVLFGTAVLAALVFLVGRRREQMQKIEDKKAQMMVDYPEILSKMILLLNAGMSMRKAFARVALDYKKYQTAAGTKSKIHYAYEELLVSFYEMERGVSEQEAYEHLGIRCELTVYRTFSVLLVQNLRKGSQGLLEVMEREAATAFEERKRRAKVLGEQASTKLLLPMAGMLLIVFAILLVPAFLSF